jgi:hypothetical protein
MNFGYKNTVEKRKSLSSNSRRIKTKAFMSFLKIFLYAIGLLIIVGGFTGLGMVKGIIRRGPFYKKMSASLQMLMLQKYMILRVQKLLFFLQMDLTEKKLLLKKCPNICSSIYRN